MIDPHVHLRDWNESCKETVIHGMSVASKACYSDLFDMPNTNPACTCEDVIRRRLALGWRATQSTGVNYHLYAGLTADTEQIKSMVDLYGEMFPRIIGFKVFLAGSTGSLAITDSEDIRKVLRTLASEGYRGVLAVHAEKEDLFRNELYREGEYRTWSDARPAESEEKSIEEITNSAYEEGFKGTLHICHVSTKRGIEIVKKARSRMSVTMGATPHHALLSSINASDSSKYLKMNPPLRSEDDRRAVFEALMDGTIDWAESDHAPHTVKDKKDGASGIPGIPGMLLLLHVLRRSGCKEERLEAIFGRNAADAFGIYYVAKPLPKNALDRYAELSKEYPFNPF